MIYVLQDVNMECFRRPTCSGTHYVTGYMGECGLRGGYAEIINLDEQVKAMYLKSISAKLCPTTLGQVGVASLPCREHSPMAELKLTKWKQNGKLKNNS